MPPTTVTSRSSDKSTPASTRRGVCPHCALLCDDIELRPGVDGSHAVTANGCTRAGQRYAAPAPAAEVHVAGRRATLEEGITAAARLLKRARHPLIGGLATDIDGTRAAVNLAERCRAILDHAHGDTLARVSRLMQTRGWYATTLSEVRSRADLVLLVDTELGDRYESFARRCLGPRAELNGNAPRTVGFIGPASRLPRAAGPDLRLACRSERVAEALLALLAELRGNPLRAARPAGLARRSLADLASRLRAARYATLVVTPGALGAACEPVLGAVCDIVDELNRTGRAALLPLGGDDGAQSAVSACTWLTGFPLRIGFGDVIRYEPQAFATATLLAGGGADALVWIDAFGNCPEPPPGHPAERTIVLAAAPSRQATPSAVHITVGTPGIDHFARLVRTDSVVTLALPQQRDSGLPSVAGVLTRIAEKL
ncbi:MAG: formylmethanofuran dehydrogenase [Gammaproteobacteria bacterium]